MMQTMESRRVEHDLVTELNILCVNDFNPTGTLLIMAIVITGGLAAVL